MAPHQPNRQAFLGVEKSLTGKRWQDRLSPAAANQALAITQQHAIPELVARVLAARDVEAEDAVQFLLPAIRDLMPDPSTLTDMDLAAKRLAKAIANRERVAIFGDYDVDGACSAALLSRYLGHFGVPNEIYIPDRIFEGYGPNPAAVAELYGKGAGLLVTVDCGIASHQALAQAERLGFDTIVLDHHQVGETLPPALARVNANRQDDLSGLGDLCACGVVFMALVAVNRDLRGAGTTNLPDLLDWLDLVALATVCDVVPLKGLNRAFVVKGIQVMQQRGNVGLSALCDVARLDGPVSTYHLGFVLGPRINAGGRIGDAALGAKLLTETDPDAAREISTELDRLNEERQAMEAAMLEEADAQAAAEIGAGPPPPVLITASAGWHPGVVGLIASRLKDRYNRPTFAVAFDDTGRGSASGRSIEGVDIGIAVRAALDKGLIEKGGGHAMAAGLTVQRNKLGDLRGFFEDKLAKSVDGATGCSTLKIDAAMTARAATRDLLALIERAGPYGAGHPAPVFAFPAHRVRYAALVGRNHVRLTLSAGDGATLKAIAFRAADQPLGRFLLENRGEPVTIAGTLMPDNWQGRNGVQLRVIDASGQGVVT